MRGNRPLDNPFGAKVDAYVVGSLCHPSVRVGPN
jgi:hypothetical protein